MELQTAEQVLRIRGLGAYRAKQIASLAQKAASGGPKLAPFEDTAPKTVYINEGRWLIDCPCGNGVPVHPEWTMAHCISCGATHTALVFPKEMTEIAAVLEQRKYAKTQHWKPGETVADLKRENVAHRVTS